MIDFIQRVDNSILILIKYNLHSGFMDQLMVLITTLGNNGLVWIVISLFLIGSKKYRKTGVLVLIALCVSTLIGDLLIKFIVQRPRPSALLMESELLIAKPLSFSFPSGHSMSSFACSGILASRLGRPAMLFVILAALIAFSRVYLYVHNPSDVLAGMVFGLMVCCLELMIVEKYFSKE